MAWTADQVANGLFGTVYDENGMQLQGTKEFSAKITFEKKEIVIAGQLLKGNKITGAKASGTLKLDHLDGRLARKIAENPFAKYQYIGQLADPRADGKEAVLLIGVSFDEVTLTAFNTGDLVERDYPFTFDDYKFLDSIGG